MIPSIPPEPQKPELIVLKTERPRKTAYVRAANLARLTLAAWMFRHLDGASGYRDEPPDR